MRKGTRSKSLIPEVVDPQDMLSLQLAIVEIARRLEELYGKRSDFDLREMKTDKPIVEQVKELTQTAKKLEDVYRNVELIELRDLTPPPPFYDINYMTKLAEELRKVADKVNELIEEQRKVRLGWRLK